MNLAAPFIRRPVMTTLVVSGLVVAGLVAFRQLPVSDLPNVDYPTIQVSASLRGGTPETMASAVATPLEREFSTIAGLDSMNSSSAQGSMQITLQFVLNRDLDAAALDVQAAIARAMRNLPPQMDTPPSYQKVNPADQPILYLALTSPTLSLYDLDEYAQTFLAQNISMVDGVAQVAVYGSQKFAVRIQLDPHQLATRGLGLDEVASAIQRGNVNLPTGILYGPSRAFAVQASGQLSRAKDYRPLIVAYRNGAPVRLGELGSVLDSVENNKVAAWYCTSNLVQRAIVLAVQRQPGKNTVQVAAEVRKLLARLNADLPAAVSLEVLIDASQSIQASYEDVKFTLLLTLVLVVLVIFVFLRNISATLIPSLALPMSMVGTFVVMAALSYSLDNLSLMALTLALGFVVDDAIVVLENIVRHREMGKDSYAAALDGTKEISFTIVSMTVSLAAVFIPVLFMGGVVGRLFREFAVTIGAAVLVSGVIALTLIPMLSARFLGASAHAGHGRLYQVMEAGFDAMLRGYAASLRWALDHRRAMMALALVMLVVAGGLFWRVPKGFMASEDRGRINVTTEAIEGISFDAMVAHQNRLIPVLQADPNVQAFMSSAGARGSSGGNTGRFIVSLKPRKDRTMTTDEVVQSLRGKLSGVPGIRVFPVNPPLINIGGRATKSQYQYTLSGTDTDELYRSAEAFMERLRGLDILQDVTSDLQLKNPELHVEIDRDLASSLQITADQVETALFNAYGSRQVSTILSPNNQYAVILEMLPQYQSDPAVLSWLHIRTGDGRLVPLDAVARLRNTVGPVTINHSGQMPSVTVSFDLKPGVALGEAVGRVNAVAREVLPPRIGALFQGSAQAFQSSFKGMGWLLVLAILVIYIVLGVLYENFFHPVTILSALPFAGVGALASLMVFGAELSVYAFVGIIMLVGLVKKNGIMMIDFAIAAQREQGKSPREAIYDACLIRFRPIMMTTMAALAAAIPIAVGYGAGGEARRPLGLTVAGGLLFSQTLTLYVTPVFYLYMERLVEILNNRRRGRSRTGRVPGSRAGIGMIVMLLLPLPVLAAGTNASSFRISVSDAILMALERNSAFRVQRFQPGIVKTREEEARSAFDPVLTGGISRNRQNGPLSAFQPATNASTETVRDTTMAEAGISGTLPTGTRVELGGRTAAEHPAFNNTASRVGVSVSQPLLEGSGLEANLVRLRQARIDTQSSVFELGGYALALVAEVEAAYWSYVESRAQMEVYRDSLAVAQQQWGETQERIRVGKLARLEAAAAEAELAVRREGLIGAESRFDVARLRLIRLLNPSDPAPWALIPEPLDHPVLPQEPLGTVESHVAAALGGRPDLNQARLALSRGELEVVRTRNGLLPKLDVFMTLGRSGYAASFDDSVEGRQARGYDAGVGVQVAYPLLNRAAGAAHRRAVAGRQQSEEALANLCQLAQEDVRGGWVLAEAAGRQGVAALATQTLQERKLEAEQLRFKEGKSTSLLVAQAERDVLAAKLNSVSSLIAVLTTRVELYHKDGSLLSRRRLVIPED